MSLINRKPFSIAYSYISTRKHSTLTGYIGTGYRLGTMSQPTSTDDPGGEEVAAAASQQNELPAGVDVAESPAQVRGRLH